MRKIQFGDVSEKPEIGDMVSLQKLQDLRVVACEETGVPMVNIDADQIEVGDLPFLKKLGLTISNPDTDRPIALGVDYMEESWGQKINDFFKSDDDDDDTPFFGTGGFLGGVGSGGFSGGSSGGFGGFGGGSFGGGGASRGF